MGRRPAVAVALALVGLTTGCAGLAASTPLRAGAPQPDAALRAAIDAVPVIDDHAHPVAASEGDAGWDVLAGAAEPDEPIGVALPARLRTGGRELLGAWRQLFGYEWDDLSAPHLAALAARRTAIRHQQGEAYPQWVLRQVGIEIMLANRAAPGPGVSPPIFPWVAYVDPLVFPLDNGGIARTNEERQAFVRGLDRARAEILVARGLSSRPVTLPEYLDEIVVPTLVDQQARGAVAVKVAAGFLRSLHVRPTPEFEARRIYAQSALGGIPSRSEYEALQDHLLAVIAREAGRLGLPVQVHTGAERGVHRALDGADPRRLEPLLDDPSLAGTEFVLLHGGWPYTDGVTAMLGKPNVYVDVSGLGWLLSARTLAGVLRPWLELYPEKVLFGTDAFPASPIVGWEELAWLATETTREALALALTGMMDDGQVTRGGAEALARGVLRENARRLYLARPAPMSRGGAEGEGEASGGSPDGGAAAGGAGAAD